MASIHTLQFGTYAKTNLGLPGVSRGTLVQICGIGVQNGKLHYAAIVLGTHTLMTGSKLGQHIGPFPAQAFTFHAQCTTADMLKLVEYVTKLQKQETTSSTQNESAAVDADSIVRTVGAVKNKAKAKRVRKAKSEQPDENWREAEGLMAAADEPPAKKGSKEPKRSTKEIAQDTKFDNSANWGFRGRLAQRAKDDLATTKNPPHKDQPEIEQGPSPYDLRDNY